MWEEQQAAEAAKSPKAAEEPVPVKTPGTRLEYSDLAGWLDAAGNIMQRKVSQAAYQARDEHIDALHGNRDLIEKAGREELEAVRDLFQDMNNRGPGPDFTLPPRGQRDDHPTTDIIKWVNNRLSVLEAGKKSAPIPNTEFVHVGSDKTTTDNKGRRKIGVNPDNYDLYEDENGVRSYSRGGIRRSEPVPITMGKDGLGLGGPDVSRRQDEFKTIEERDAADKYQPVAGLEPTREEKRLSVEANAAMPDGYELVRDGASWSLIAPNGKRIGGLKGTGRLDSGAVKGLIAGAKGHAKSALDRGDKEFGASNKIFTKDAADAAREVLRKKLKGQLSAGLDPEIIQAGIQLSGFYIEGGARKFADYSAKMIGDLGDAASPYLKSWYLAVRNYPGFDNKDMESEADLEAAEASKQVQESLDEHAQALDDADARAEANKAEAKEPASDPIDDKAARTRVLSDRVLASIRQNKSLTWRELQDMANEQFGGTLADGVWVWKDAYDAVELAVNHYILYKKWSPTASATVTKARVAEIEALLARIPTQTRRDAETDEFQQFSTPPHYALAAAWAANMGENDIVLEPSAGLGGLAVWAQTAGVNEVIVNELSKRRSALLRGGAYDRQFAEDASRIDSILAPKNVNPTVVLMNPPFSSTAGRIKSKKVQSVQSTHVEQALKRLTPGGRLVAIVGRGMSPEAPTFKDWFERIGTDHTIRAVIRVDGNVFRKYGTTFDTQLLVIDKVVPDDDAGMTPVIDTVDSTAALIDLLEDIRDERIKAKPAPAESKGEGVTAAGGGASRSGSPVRSPTGEVGAGERGGAGTSGVAGTDQPDGGNPDGGRPRSGDGIPDGGGQRQPAKRPRPDRPDAGRGGDRAGRERPSEADRDRAGVHAAEGPPELAKTEEREAEAVEHELTDELYETYRPERVKIAGAVAHPTPVVQSAAMTATKMPKSDYQPHIPKKLITSGELSDIQVEAIIYAGMAHEQMLPGVEGEPDHRRGFFIGDGTGVGKGRAVAGIIMDNVRRGRKRAVWFSKDEKLWNDAIRDWTGIGGAKGDLFKLSKARPASSISRSAGIMFGTYDTLSRESKGEAGAQGVSRIDQIVEWLGDDFDGVIAFDEAHKMGNSMAIKGARGNKKPSARALAGIELQRRLPNARIVYISATGATEIQNLGYAERLGLWGRGTAFPTKESFVGAMVRGGIAAMELVARDLKSQGLYIARSLSFDGVEYDRIEHKLTPEQTKIYDKMAEAWQFVLANLGAALEETSQDKNGRAKSAALSAFWGGHQRFFNQILTSMQMPTALVEMEKDIKAGNAVVIQLVSTLEAQAKRQMAKVESAADLEFLDMTPREGLMQYIERSFPIYEYEEYETDDGNILSRPVLNSDGDNVVNPTAVAKRDRLLDEVATLRVPDGALEMLFNKFGADAIAEVTGRTQRVVTITDEQGTRKVIQKRGAQAGIADADDFQADKKQILVFSDAGGTGRSYHAERNAGNQRRRMHYLLQPGWRADNAVQGFGRTHRSNQTSAPFYKLTMTDIQGHRRFVSSIARRLDQLGALTKGQRQAGAQGLFREKDNLESDYAADALDALYLAIYKGEVEGLTIEAFERQTGMALVDKATGGLKSSLPP
ncbi:MAG: strawberry notch family protein, partial [Paracoccaceae bacterium]|nr:strawberry notch family protein [Paracoccaceae bacterium]